MAPRFAIARYCSAAILLIAPLSAIAESAADFNALGVERFDEGDFEGAINAFVDAFNLAPDNKTIRTNLANAYQAAAHSVAKSGELSDIEAGARILEEAIGIDPKNPGPLVQLGSYYLRLDYDQDAMFRLEEALQLDSSNAAAKELLGDAYYKSNKLADAIAIWEKTLAETPSRTTIQPKLDKARREMSVEGGYKSQATRSKFFEISFAPGTRYHEVTNIVRTLDKARRDVGRQIGIYPDTTTQVVIYTADDFSQAMDVGAHIGALFDGKMRIPLDDRQGQKLDGSELERRLIHEYVHVVVRYVAGNRAPWWLNEGLAETLSNKLEQKHVQALTQSLNSEQGLFLLEELEGSQLERLDAKQLALAYIQSHATVDYLIRRFGVRKMSDLLNFIADGERPAKAMQAVYRRSYEQIQRETLTYHRVGS